MTRRARGSRPINLEGRIAFASDRDGDFEIFTMRGDGTDLKRLTHNRFDDVQPTWEPTGRRIVFVRKFSSTNSDLIVMDSDGSNARTLTVETARQPEWFMTGKWIAFTSSGSSATGKDVRLIRPSGGEVLGFADMDRYVEKYLELFYEENRVLVRGRSR